MSATIYYQPIKGKSLSIGGPSSFIAAMERALGCPPPWELCEGDYDVLRGLAAGLVGEASRAIETLLDEIEKYGDVRVWLQY